MSVWDYFKKTKTAKRPLRDKHGRAYYLTAIPWHRRNPRLFVVGGGLLALGVVFSAPLYSIFFRKPEDVPYQADWWRHEVEQGYRDVDYLRAKIATAGPNASMKQVFEAKPDPALLKRGAGPY